VVRHLAGEPGTHQRQGVSAGARAAVFLDRDGVIVRNRDDYVKSWDEVEVLPGAVASIARLSRAGHPVMVVTNQSAVGRGMVRRDVVDGINERLGEMVLAQGGRIDGFFVCPHRPDEHCGCRKPEPGLLLEAERRTGIDLATAYVVGDQACDVAAGRAAGCRPILVRSGAGDDAAADGCPVASDLAAAADLILGEAG
jgi:D-glycero-D-manno-heptose 1,7-bisphosphate phosphatase